MMTLHASALLNFQNTVCIIYILTSVIHIYVYVPVQADVSKVIEVRDGPEGLTKEVIDAKLLG